MSTPIAAAVGDWLSRATHADPPIDPGDIILLLTIGVTAAFAVWYLHRRLRGRPDGLLAVSTRFWPVEPVAFPDTTDGDGEDSDGDPIAYPIHYIQFTPDVDRTFVLPLDVCMAWPRRSPRNPSSRAGRSPSWWGTAAVSGS
ncbi:MULTISPECIES: hypothetical protein [Bifidobacterium]|uniref:Uncharacterized protein n=1 Tax=Bifidobacterium miconis TaxID=2834435 RepID=A0ABS6WGM9_9BIFI|nr:MULTISPECIES: hypothetical protein [Bifidobacterium]MBT1163327.1 hypothetical protein [Bifidobacterium felsineum]MBT1181636.1 hypothetical protein [Bifidobacterium sp. CP2]MBW3093196.1 hypothetical protein [Bifidobacterium miconis]